MHTHAGSTYYNLDLLASGYMAGQRVYNSICVPSLVLTAQVKTQSQMPLINISAITGMVNNQPVQLC